MTLIIVVCVLVIVAYAIYKISRENAGNASSPASAATYTTPVANDAGVPSHDVFSHILSHEQSPDSGGVQLSSAGMIPISMIEQKVEQLKVRYHGERREELVARIDEAMRELKLRYGSEVPLQELLAFMKDQREKLFPSER